MELLQTNNYFIYSQFYIYGGQGKNTTNANQNFIPKTLKIYRYFTLNLNFGIHCIQKFHLASLIQFFITLVLIVAHFISSGFFRKRDTLYNLSSESYNISFSYKTASDTMCNRKNNSDKNIKKMNEFKHLYTLDIKI